MQYRVDTKSGNKLSVLGFGCMRFPRNPVQTDMKKTEELILRAIEQGVNYFDTAYVYPGSEEAFGTILHKNNVRDKVFIATKLPHVKCKTYEDFDRIFSEELKRLNTDYIDYYLIHNIPSVKAWERVCDLGIEKWITEKKAEGKIRQIGFSFHGIQSEFMKLLDMYDWEFCQIQYNYMNINYQAGQAGLKKAHEKGIPVIIMEPLLGGRLAVKLPPKVLSYFKKVNETKTPAAWALEWLWNQEEVTVVLSGMNSSEQLDENIKIAGNSSVNMFSKEETEVFEPVIEAFKQAEKVSCTGCNYCLPCPQNVNIPGCFAAYNAKYTLGSVTALTQYITSTNATKPKYSSGATKCIKCGKCEKQCPQNIKIIKSLEDVSKHMEPLWFKIVIKVLSKVMG